jgi:hypothetical protein
MARCQPIIPSFPWGINCAAVLCALLSLPFPSLVGRAWPHPHPTRIQYCMQFRLITSVSRLSPARLPQALLLLLLPSFRSPGQTIPLKEEAGRNS